MIKDATANKVTEDIFDEKYGVAGIGLQLKMLMWRAYIARYKVNSHQNHFLPGWSYRSVKQLIQLRSKYIHQNFLLEMIYVLIAGVLCFGLTYIRYPRLNSVVPYNDDDLYGINGCLFVVVTSFNVQVLFCFY